MQNQTHSPLTATSQTSSSFTTKKIAVFFYGSFMRREVLARGGFEPDYIDVAKLNGFDINIDPHANIHRSDQHAIYGILVRATHEELKRLYSMEGVGVFLPEAVIVEMQDGRLCPALCYIPPEPGNKPADRDYLECLIKVACEYNFPDWYIERLAQIR
mgnify:CR=1 FL=1